MYVWMKFDREIKSNPKCVHRPSQQQANKVKQKALTNTFNNTTKFIGWTEMNQKKKERRKENEEDSLPLS